MLRVEDNLDKNCLPHVCTALFWCLWVPGGGLEPFWRISPSGGRYFPQSSRFFFEFFADSRVQRTFYCNGEYNWPLKTCWNTTSSPGPSARYPRQMALVQADITGIVSGGSAKILFLFLIAQTGLNNAMRMSIVLKFCEFCCVFTFGFIFTFKLCT